MKSSLVAILACTFGIAAGLAGATPTRTAADAIQLRGLMSASDEVPAPTGNVAAAKGTFTATATRTAAGATLEWRLTFSGLTGNANAAHVHRAARGVAGPVVIPLCGPCTSGATGTANADAALLASIQSGETYVNVHTTANPAGEVRGQLGSIATVRSVLSARQETPRPKGATRATGRFAVTAVKTGSSATLTWRLSFSKLTGRATAAHIHLGRRGVAGGVAVPLCGPCRTGATGRATVSGAALAALEAGTAYVNVHTARNPAGEIRGQIPAVPVTITP